MTTPEPRMDAGDAHAEVEDRAVAEMETTVAYALRWGVLLSFAIVLLGSVLLFAHGDTGYGNVRVSGAHAVDTLTGYRGSDTAGWFPTTPSEVLAGVRHGRPYAVITLGLLVLIATPVFRVAVSVLTFAWERDRLYVAITVYVLAVLLVSFVIGKG
jgi:uncharacterized membrane protein